MCGENHNHSHGADVGSRLTDGGKEIQQAVDSPVDKVYDNPRIFVREMADRFYDHRHIWEDLRDPDKRVIKGKDIPLKSKTEDDRIEGSMQWGKSYVRPWKGITQSMSLMERVLAPEGEDKQHTHQSEAMMYVLEGKGYEIHDGEEYTWEAGDLVVIEGGVVHSHYSADPDNPCRVLVTNAMDPYNYLNLVYQGTVRHTPDKPAKEKDWTPPWPWAEGREEYSEEDARKYRQMREQKEKDEKQRERVQSDD